MPVGRALNALSRGTGGLEFNFRDRQSKNIGVTNEWFIFKNYGTVALGDLEYLGGPRKIVTSSFGATVHAIREN